MHKNRAILADILTATAGHQVCNLFLVKEMQDAIKDQELQASLEEIEQLCYRIRVQMSHLRDAKIKNFAIPQRCAAVNGIVHMITVDSPPVAAKAKRRKLHRSGSTTPKAKHRKLDRSDSSASQSANSPMPPFDATHSNQHVLALADEADEDDEDSDNSVQEIQVVKIPAPRVDLEIELDDVLADLFTHPQPQPLEDVPDVASTPKKKVGQSADTPEKLDNAKVVVNYTAVEAVLAANSKTTPPPTLAEYNKLFKRPAAAKKKKKKKRQENKHCEN